MKVVIMAAGAGSRYAQEGFTVSKPLVHYHGAPMIEWVIDGFRNAGANEEDIIVVATPQVADYVRSITHIKVVEVPVLQNGPGMSVLLAGGYIKPDEYVVLADSDSIIDQLSIHEMLHPGLSKVACKLIEGPTTAYSSLVTAGNVITDIEEKTGRTSLVSVGMYAFRSWKLFQDEVAHAIVHSPSEVFIAPLLRLDHPIAIEVEAWINLGTPADLKKASK